jgi:hypothetical protein
MKNHEWQDGRLIQTNKQWSHLKMRQREWIQGIIKEEHADYMREHDRLPTKGGKRDIVNRVYERIDERGIWIPYGEAYGHIVKSIERLNKKAKAQADTQIDAQTATRADGTSQEVSPRLQ